MGRRQVRRPPFEPASRGLSCCVWVVLKACCVYAPYFGVSHCLFAGHSWLALQDELESVALAFAAKHKRPPVLVIDGADSIAKGSRKLAIDIVSLAKARASCHRPVAVLASWACCEVQAACLHRHVLGGRVLGGHVTTCCAATWPRAGRPRAVPPRA